jgi:hypothetical protein
MRPLEKMNSVSEAFFTRQFKRNAAALGAPSVL